METNPSCPSCPSCQKPLPTDLPLGLCPDCLLKAGFNTATESGGQNNGFVPPPLEEIARLFPQLEIIEFIGKGGMGAVYKARQPALDRFVALKILPPRVAGAPGFAERFNREARALAKLMHPNIVAVHDFGKAGELHYLLMEYVDGANLREVERAGRITPEQALAIVPQICEALQFAHNEGIVHRDIKPENLLMDKKGRVKITDFGIAKIVGQTADKAMLTGARDVVGTPLYMAPEQVETPSLVDHRADIYSLGVVFYEMLTGELPLGRFAPPSQRARVDVRLDEVVLHALEKEPERRYQHASEVKAEVETIAGTPEGRADADRETSPDASMPLFPWSGGLSFRSPRALAIARSGWILGCMAALGFLPGWEWMFNFLGFFGLIGVAIAMESVHRSRRGGSGASEIATPLFPKSFGLTFRSRLALRIARGGFFLGCLAALGFIPGLRAMFGFAGFFGLLGIAVLIEVVHKLRIAGVPLFVDRDGRRQIYWPGHVMLYSTIGLVAAACCAIIAMFVATADGPATAQSGGAMFICCLLAAMGCGTLHAVAAKRAALDASQLQQAQPSRLRTAATGLGILFSLVIAFALAARFGWLREIALSWMPNPRTVVSQTIQNEVGRQLKAAGATYEDLHVSAADNRDSGTPFAVEYRGLSHFKSAGGTSFTNAAGEFIMAYNGGGQYRGTLRGTQFIVSVGRVDNIDLPFIDDPDAIGEWKSVDFVSDESDFNPGRQRFGGELYFKGVTFLQEGKTPQPWFTWTKGVLIHQGDKTASHYDIQHVNGERYMFLEHKTGDYLFLGKTPMYYVLRWIGPPATQP